MTANSKPPFLSVVIPACNPGMRHFQIVLEALRNQTLPKDRWELIVVDDASRTPLKAVKRDDFDRGQFDILKDKEPVGENSKITKSQMENAEIDLSWHPNARLVETDAEREGLGLVSARLRGFELGRGDVFVFVDQDNALRPDYLQGVAEIAVEYPHIGTWGGQILLKFDEPEKAPDPWLRGALCTRELEADIWSNVIDHHDSTPWGAGLCARRQVLAAYHRQVQAHPMRRLLDPTPLRPGFGGDSDMAYAGCRAGYGKGAFKRLVLDHLIPAGRCSDSYLLKVAEVKGYSTAVHCVVEHGRVIPPRSGWRFWAMSWARRVRLRRLEWEVEMATRRGMREAMADVAQNAGQLERYAAKLAEKSRALSLSVHLAARS